VAVAVMLLAPASLAACGDGDTAKKNAYVEQVNRAQEQFAATYERLAAQVTATSSPSEDRRTLRGFQTATDRTVSDLRKISPPEEVAELHRDLVAEITGYGEAIGTARMRLRDPSSITQITRAQAKLAEETSQTSAAVNRTISEINARLRE
jgi:hypothetical protein